jgi:hypothetical protein
VVRKEEEAYVDKPVRSYQDLVAWQKAMELVTKIYRVSYKFPREEIFGLTSQLRRAAVSVPSNIAEVTRVKDFFLFLLPAIDHWPLTTGN